MSTEAMTEQPPKPAKAPARRKARKRAKPAAPKTADRPVTTGAGEFAGISATRCPAACTVDRCVISTVAVCKHPFMTGDSGCGPTTMANRARAKKLIKHQLINTRE